MPKMPGWTNFGAKNLEHFSWEKRGNSVFASFGEHDGLSSINWVFSAFCFFGFGLAAFFMDQGLLVSVVLVFFACFGASLCVSSHSLQVDFESKRLLRIVSSPLLISNSKQTFRFDRYTEIAAVSLHGDGQHSLIFYAIRRDGYSLFRKKTILSMFFEIEQTHLIEPILEELSTMTGWTHSYRRLGAIEFLWFYFFS